MLVSEAAETCFELIQCKCKNVWRRHVLMQTYYALSTANVHVKNSNRIVYFSYFKEHYQDYTLSLARFWKINKTISARLF